MSETTPPRVLAIIPAAGSGTRFGGDLPKQFQPLAGKAIIQHVIERFIIEGSALRIVVPVTESLVAVVDQPGERVQFVAGGATRQQSVIAGMNAADGEYDIVIVHDAVRPFFGLATFRAVVAAAVQDGAAIPGMPVTETIHRVRDGVISETFDRGQLVSAQTPQAFRFDLLKDVLARAVADRIEGTDEAGLAVHYGHPVRVVPGDSFNLKITRRDDLTLSEMHFDEWSAE